MNSFSYLKIIAVITVFVLALLIFFLLTVKTKNKIPNRLFASYLIINAIDISGFFLAEKITSNYPNLEIFRWTLCLLSIPLFYLYVQAICYNDFRLKRKHLLHFALFILFNLILIPRIYQGNDTAKKYFFRHHFETGEMILFQSIIELQYLGYIIAVFIILKKYKSIYLENYTNSNASVYKWLFQMTTFFVIAHYFDTLKNLLRYTNYHEFLIVINEFAGIIALAITCWFILKALNNPDLFKSIDSKSKNKSKTVTLTDLENHRIMSQIELLKEHMNTAKPYLNPSLTIQELANQINVPVSELSVLINVHLNQHFFDFINQYRIGEAMEILKNHPKKDFTILQTLDKVGFNSKSSFNTAFKKHTTLTPTEYRKSSLL